MYVSVIIFIDESFDRIKDQKNENQVKTPNNKASECRFKMMSFVLLEGVYVVNIKQQIMKEKMETKRNKSDESWLAETVERFYSGKVRQGLYKKKINEGRFFQ